MTLPGFNAEASFYSSGLSYSSVAVAQAIYTEAALRPAADSCICTSPNCTWSCPAPPPPDCTTTGCPPGQICCDCVDPPRRPSCTSARRCKTLCSL